MDNEDTIIRLCAAKLQEEIDLRERIMQEYDFWDRNMFFVSDEHKDYLKLSHQRSDEAVKILNDAIKRKDESRAIFINIQQGR